MKLSNGIPIYSPTDLIVFVESPFASWMDRRYLEDPDSLSPDEDDPFMQILQTRGIAHESKYLGAIGSDQRKALINS
jgi:uncharacterized protein